MLQPPVRNPTQERTCLRGLRLILWFVFLFVAFGSGCCVLWLRLTDCACFGRRRWVQVYNVLADVLFIFSAEKVKGTNLEMVGFQAPLAAMQTFWKHCEAELATLGARTHCQGGGAKGG